MSEESAFLRGILADPADAATRLVYADWLEERGDPRAHFVRLEPSLERINFVAWLEKDGRRDDYYLMKFPEVKRESEKLKAEEPLRDRRRALSEALDPDWVAFINAFGCPFEPFFFFNNGGNPREIGPDELPFAERIGTRGSVITFESSFRDGTAWDQGLMSDVGFLSQLDLKTCYFGAADCPLHPFICELRPKRRPLVGADVLAALKPRNFRSDHIETLEAANIPFPGYHPGTPNDEIHNDFLEQHIFRSPKDEDGDDGPVDKFSGTHGKLKRFVANGQLWYVLLHTTPQKVSEFRLSRYVILFAVGKSPNGDRLVGVVTHQVCHNLCD